MAFETISVTVLNSHVGLHAFSDSATQFKRSEHIDIKFIQVFVILMNVLHYDCSLAVCVRLIEINRD